MGLLKGSIPRKRTLQAQQTWRGMGSLTARGSGYSGSMGDTESNKLAHRMEGVVENCAIFM